MSNRNQWWFINNIVTQGTYTVMLYLYIRIKQSMHCKHYMTCDDNRNCI